MILDPPHMRIRTFALLLGLPLLLMGALVVGLRLGEGELEESVRTDPATPTGTDSTSTSARSRRRRRPAECA